MHAESQRVFHQIPIHKTLSLEEKNHLSSRADRGTNHCLGIFLCPFLSRGSPGAWERMARLLAAQFTAIPQKQQPVPLFRIIASSFSWEPPK